jgi:hypothetical protein
MKLICTFAIATIFYAFSASAQGTFQNLDFESAYPNIQPSTAPGMYSVTTALPDWNVYYGANQQYAQQSQMGYQILSTGQTFVTLLGPTNGPFATSISGNFSLLLQGGVTAASASISQTGLVPASAQSIQFEGQSGAGPLLVSLDGQNIPIVAIGTGPNYTLYGGNVSAFADQTALLQFSAPEGYNANNNWNIDDIAFSPNSVPEPQTWTLLLSGAATLLAAACWKRKA